MAFQPPPLANSLYLAMLQQERQDNDREHARFIEDDDRRNRSMVAVAEFSLKKQAQDQAHERELQKLELQRQVQRSNEAFKQQQSNARASQGHVVDLYKQDKRLAADAGKQKYTKGRNAQTDARATQRLGLREREVQLKEEMSKRIGPLKLQFDAAMKVTNEKRSVMDSTSRALNKSFMSKSDPTLLANYQAAKNAYDTASQKSDQLSGLVQEGRQLMTGQGQGALRPGTYEDHVSSGGTGGDPFSFEDFNTGRAQ